LQCRQARRFGGRDWQCSQIIHFVSDILFLQSSRNWKDKFYEILMHNIVVFVQQLWRASPVQYVYQYLHFVNRMWLVPDLPESPLDGVDVAAVAFLWGGEAADDLEEANEDNAEKIAKENF
jgi:hypothetical protein